MTPVAPPVLAFLGSIGWQELLILGMVGLLIFGKRLPEVGRSLGKGIVEFKKGLSGIEDEVNKSSKSETPRKSIEGTSPRVETTSQSETKAEA
jgi:sec-independent protein translocase protein TatA